MTDFTRTKIAAICAAFMLTACGGGGGGDSVGGDAGGGGGGGTVAGTTLSGTAAGGAPLVGTVTVKDSLGAVKMVSIEADGTYKVDVTGMTGPFMMRASGMVGGIAVNYYSAATTADLGNTINVTPFTTIMISNIAAKLADAYFEDGKFSGEITTANLDAAKSALQQKLAPALEALGLSATIDLLRESFKADHSGLDAALDLIKVSIDPETNVATLTNALTGAQIAQDELNSKADDATPAVLTPEEKAALGGAKTDMQKVQEVLNNFAKLFSGTGLPSITQLENSGVFDTSNFSMGGANFNQFASDVSTEEELLGMQLISSDLQFNGTNNVTAKVKLVYKGGSSELIDFTLARADANSAWKITGDGRIVDLEVRPYSIQAENAGSSTPTSFDAGIELYANPDYYNVNHSGAMIDRAVITGPGVVPLPGKDGIEFSTKVGLDYMAQVVASYSDPAVTVVSDTSMIQQCKAGVVINNCIELSNVADNAQYNVKVYSGATLLNGSGYNFTLPKKPVSQANSALFPAITSVTIDGNAVTSLGGFQANKNLSLGWTMPAGVNPNWVHVQFLKGNPPGSAGREKAEFDLYSATTNSQLIALEDMPTGATFAHIWLTGKDVYNREFITTRRYHN